MECHSLPAITLYFATFTSIFLDRKDPILLKEARQGWREVPRLLFSKWFKHFLEILTSKQHHGAVTVGERERKREREREKKRDEIISHFFDLLGAKMIKSTLLWYANIITKGTLPLISYQNNFDLQHVYHDSQHENQKIESFLSKCGQLLMYWSFNDGYSELLPDRPDTVWPQLSLIVIYDNFISGHHLARAPWLARALKSLRIPPLLIRPGLDLCGRFYQAAGASLARR